MKYALLLVLALSPAFAFAGTVKDDVAKIDTANKACLDDPENQSTVGMKMCMGEAYEAADALLNKVYKGIVANLKKKTGDSLTDKDNAETLRRLVASQRAWIAFRDTNAALAGTTMLGGTGEGLAIVGVAYDMTKARVIEIDETINGSFGSN